MNPIERLQELNITPNEARVYVVLLRLGMVTAGPLVEKTKLHRQVIYEALSRLRTYQLVSVLVINNRKHFQASSPSVLVERQQRIASRAKELASVLSDIQKKGDEGIDVRISYGKDEYVQYLLNFVHSAERTDGIIRIIGGADDSIPYRIMGSFYKKYTQELSRMRVKKHLIAASGHSSVFKEKFAHERGTVLKTMHTGLVSPTFTRMTSEMVGIEVFTEDVMVIQIRNQSIARAYLDHFNLLWKQATVYRTRKKVK